MESLSKVEMTTILYDMCEYNVLALAAIRGV